MIFLGSGTRSLEPRVSGLEFSGYVLLWLRLSIGWQALTMVPMQVLQNWNISAKKEEEQSKCPRLCYIALAPATL